MAPRDLDALAKAVKERRIELGLGYKSAAKEAGIAPDTWKRIETGLPVRELSYAKVDPVLQWAPGSCKAVLGGRSPVPVAPAEGAPGVSISPVPPEALEAAKGVVQLAAIATTNGLTSEQIRALSEKVIQDLQEKGYLGG
ncbi:helix-turn-helix domain-containing protein [Streptomyces sp. NPDC053493]|uniref:helix-turn-helix domain-containing protein n=1 Tax=Streptomyces sp. NPDC053493 TaxID=3365705 RepID=UPI0037D8881E